MYLVWGPEYALLYNDAYIEILGERHPWAFGVPFAQAWPDAAAEVIHLFERVLDGEVINAREAPFVILRGGVPVQGWFDFALTPLRDDNGRIHGALCVCAERTAEVVQRTQAARQLAFLTQTLGQAPCFFAVVKGPEHRYVFTNEAHRELHGRDVVGLTVREATAPPFADALVEILDRVEQSGETVIQRAIKVPLPDRVRFATVGFHPLVEEGRRAGVLIVGFDVTAAHETERYLAETEARFQTITDAMPQLVFAGGERGLTYVNSRFCTYVGESPPELLEYGWVQFVHPDEQDSTLRAWNNAVAARAQFELRLRLRGREGEYRWMLARALPVKDSRGKISQWMGTCTDIHDAYLLMEAMRRADVRKDEFLAMLSHELRNPLAPIVSAAILLPQVNDSPRVGRLAEIIARQARHLTGLVDDLLDVSRVTRGKVQLANETVALASVLTEALEQVHPAAEARGQIVSADLPDHAITLRGDRKRLVQVFANILQNAGKYTPEAGRIRLTARVAGARVRVVVQDNGVGMTPELCESAFELFVQGAPSADRSQEGLGVGLALVKSLVLLHGGTVSAHSEGPGQGSSVTVELPMVEAPDLESTPRQ